MRSFAALCIAMLMAFATLPARAQAPVRLGIVEAKPGEARRFKALASYLKASGVPVTLVSFPRYADAARMFTSGSLDAMSCGSSMAGVLLLKNLAEPTVRAVSTSGSSTYRSLILARKGAPTFRGEPSYFRGKRVVITSASSGEFFFLALPHAAETAAQVLRVATHDRAIDALAKRAADLAVVKDRTWASDASRYPELAVVGQDDGEEPDDTLMFSKRIGAGTMNRVTDALLALRSDATTEAAIVKEVLGVREYIRTTSADFKHTLANLKRAGVNASYEFK